MIVKMKSLPHGTHQYSHTRQAIVNQIVVILDDYHIIKFATLKTNVYSHRPLWINSLWFLMIVRMKSLPHWKQMVVLTQETGNCASSHCDTWQLSKWKVGGGKGGGGEVGHVHLQLRAVGNYRARILDFRTCHLIQKRMYFAPGLVTDPDRIRFVPKRMNIEHIRR